MSKTVEFDDYHRKVAQKALAFALGNPYFVASYEERECIKDVVVMLGGRR